MLRSYNFRLVWMLFLILGLWSVAAHAERYRYNSLNHLTADNLSFSPVDIDDKGRVYGTVRYSDSDYTDSKIGVYAHGKMKILEADYFGFANVANNRGTVGGGIYYERPLSFSTQAALFHGDQFELVPFKPGDFSSAVVALNDRGTAVVRSNTSEFPSVTFSLYYKGKSHLLDLEPGASVQFINNRGIIAGTTTAGFGRDNYSFRFDPVKNKLTLLNPILTDASTLVQGIDSGGDVLGYSYITDATERIGVWNRKGIFTPYFIEGTKRYPTLSNRLRFNDKHLIVISDIYSPDNEIGRSYLIPKPGVRWNLAHLVDGMPEGRQLSSILEINNQGDMIGLDYSNGEYFLLERIKNAHE